MKIKRFFNKLCLIKSSVFINLFLVSNPYFNFKPHKKRKNVKHLAAIVRKSNLYKSL